MMGPKLGFQVNGTHFIRVRQAQAPCSRSGGASTAPVLKLNSIECKSGGLQTPPGVARLTIVVNATPATLDFTSTEIEECESIVAGDPWHKIAAFIGRLAR